VHLQLSPLNLAPTFLFAGLACTQCTALATPKQRKVRTDELVVEMTWQRRPRTCSDV